MPKARRSHKPQLNFSVTPWQSAKRNQQDSSATYSEVLIPVCLTRNNPTGNKSHTSGRQSLDHTVAGSYKQGIDTIVWEANSSEQPQANCGFGGSCSVASSDHLESDDDCSAPEVRHREAFRVSTPPPALKRHCFRGTAYLVFLPDGQVSGHFVDQETLSCLGILGKELTVSDPDCTWNADWKLLQLTMIDNATGLGEVKFLAERREGDGAKLTAPVNEAMFDSNALALLYETCSCSAKDVQLSFDCSTLLVDEAAEQHLNRFHPMLRGVGAIVNQGHMALKDVPFQSKSA